MFNQKWTLILGLVSVFLFSAFNIQSYSTKPINPEDPQTMRSSAKLKKYMGHFGTLVAGVEIIHAKEGKKPDWEVIKLTLDEMEKTLKDMKKADVQKNYEGFTLVLEKQLQEAQAQQKKKNAPEFYESFKQITNTCFSCHSVHRPRDYWMPKKKGPVLSQEP